MSCKYAAAHCSRTQKRGGGFRSKFIRALTVTYRLTDHPCNDKWIGGALEDTGPAKGPAKGHLPVASEKMVSPQSTHIQTNINMRGKQ